MSEFTVDDLVNFAIQNDAVNVKRAFDDIMVNKIEDAIEGRREEVGVSLFGEPEPELEDENDQSEDDYSDEENLEDIEEEESDDTDE